ncbi:hypothetical protein P8452_57237 [Trifolium repens]|nr:hypothetical protein P8452_57237 [Trifolium repens]
MFRNVISIDEYASCFENIDLLAPYKKWTKLDAAKNPKFDQCGPQIDIFSERVQATFIVSDPVDWSRDIQISLMIYWCLTLLGTRYGASLRKQIKKMEVSQHIKFFCEFCGKYAVKRKAVGIWGCKDCGKVKAWGAYTLKSSRETNRNYWPSRAVTFLENHDTGSTQVRDLFLFLSKYDALDINIGDYVEFIPLSPSPCGHWTFARDKLMQGYTYILTHPETVRGGQL